MTARVDTDAVRGIITTSQSDDALDGFIDTAHTLVDTYLLGTGQSEAILTKIELYLAAHFVAISDNSAGVIRDVVGESSMSFSDVFDKGFNSTHFGQAALAFDASGTLVSLSTSKLRAEFRVESC